MLVRSLLYFIYNHHDWDAIFVSVLGAKYQDPGSRVPRKWVETGICDETRYMQWHRVVLQIYVFCLGAK